MEEYTLNTHERKRSLFVCTIRKRTCVYILFKQYNYTNAQMSACSSSSSSMNEVVQHTRKRNTYAEPSLYIVLYSRYTTCTQMFGVRYATIGEARNVYKRHVAGLRSTIHANLLTHLKQHAPLMPMRN